MDNEGYHHDIDELSDDKCTNVPILPSAYAPAYAKRLEQLESSYPADAKYCLCQLPVCAIRTIVQNLNSLLRSSAAFQWKVQPSASIISNFTQVNVYCVHFNLRPSCPEPHRSNTTWQQQETHVELTNPFPKRDKHLCRTLKVPRWTGRWTMDCIIDSGNGN